MNWSAILEALKDFKPVRFYFIVTLIFILTVGHLFKDEIGVVLKDITFDQVEFQDARDLKGLEVAMNKITDENSIIKDYTVYLYQPKEKPYLKRVVVTNSDLVKSSVVLRNGYIEDQPTINESLKTKDYVLLTKDMNDSDTRLLRDLGIEYLLVYKLFYRNTIGEIFVTFEKQPTTQEIDIIIKELSPLIHIYIL